MSDVRPRAFAKRSVDADAGAVDPEAVKRLAFFWNTLTPVAQGYFEELYEAMPEKVSTVVAGAILPRGGEHTTIASWAEGGKDDGGGVDTSGKALFLGEIKVEPDNPGLGAPFAVVWSLTADDKGFPARKDKAQILNTSGEPVTEKIVDQPPLAAGERAQGRADFGAVPLGSYQVLVVANVEGGDGSSMNEHGLQSHGAATFVVGQTREAQLAVDAPKFSKAVSLLQSAINMNATVEVRPGNQEEGIPPELALDDHTKALLAEAADDLATMDVMADGFKRALGNAANWLRSDPYIGETEWTTLRGQLLGLRADQDEAGKYAAGFIEALEQQSDRPFVT